MKSVIKPISCALIALLGFNASNWAPTVYARESATQSLPDETSYTVSYEIPEKGWIDRFHNVHHANDRLAYSLYLLRNTAVEDLINTRRALRILIGDADRLKKISNEEQLNLAVPGSISQLYKFRLLDPNTQESAGQSENQIGKDLEQYLALKNTYDESLRMRLMDGLADISATLTRLDQHIKFLETDYLSDPGISEQFHQEIIFKKWHGQDPRKLPLREQEGYAVDVSNSMNEWRKNHSFEEKIEEYKRLREDILNRYHLLSIEIGIEGEKDENKKPLYQHIYAAMENEGFPRARMAQRPVSYKLPAKGASVEPPTEFEYAVEAANGKASYLRETFVTYLYKKTNHWVDKALLISLKANTDALALLGSVRGECNPRSFEEGCMEPLLELARYEDLWRAMLSKYSYLSGMVDIRGAHKELKQYWAHRDRLNTGARYATLAVGLGLGVVGFAYAYGGTAIALGSSGINLNAWLYGAGLAIDAGTQYGFYSESKLSAQTAKNLFLGGTRLSSIKSVEGTLKLSYEDYRNMLVSFATLGAYGFQLARISARASQIANESQKSVRLSEKGVTEARKTLVKLSEKLEKTAPMANAMIDRLANMLGMSVKQNKMIRFTEGIEQIAKRLHTQPKKVWTLAEKVPGLGYMIKGWRERELLSRVQISEQLLFELEGKIAKIPLSFNDRLIVNGINEFVIDISSEYASRGEKMWGEESTNFVVDMVRGTAISAILVWTGFPSRLTPSKDVNRPMKEILKEEAVAWTKSIIPTGITGALIQLGADGADELVDYYRYGQEEGAVPIDQRLKDVLKGTAWSGGTVGLSSTFRYRTVQFAETYVLGMMFKNPASKWLAIQSAWAANNFFGGWSYITWGQGLEMLSKAPEEKPDEAFGKSYYLKITPGKDAASQMFDFLRDGPKTANTALN